MADKKVMSEEKAAEALEKMKGATKEELPVKGYRSREDELRRQDDLQAEAERIASQMQAGTVDPSKLEIANEIASRTQFLSVSDADPAFVYGWVSRNRHGQHVQSMKQLGWIVVQGDDREAIELKGTQGGQGTMPGTTRELGDVLLMKIPREKYVVLKALEVAQTRQLQKASTANLVEMRDKYRDKGVIVRPFGMDDPDGDLSGPEIKPQRFTSRKGALQMIDRQLRDGSVAGMEITK